MNDHLVWSLIDPGCLVLKQLNVMRVVRLLEMLKQNSSEFENCQRMAVGRRMSGLDHDLRVEVVPFRAGNFDDSVSVVTERVFLRLDGEDIVVRDSPRIRSFGQDRDQW